MLLGGPWSLTMPSSSQFRQTLMTRQNMNPLLSKKSSALFLIVLLMGGSWCDVWFPLMWFRKSIGGGSNQSRIMKSRSFGLKKGETVLLLINRQGSNRFLTVKQESNERDVMNLHANVEERTLWTAYPSWRQFTWLYFFSLMTGLRGLLFYVFAISGWESWFGGTALLLLVPVCLRRWAVYSITSRRLLVKNGYTGREIVTMPLERVGEVSIKQGPIARVTGIGTVVVRDANGAELLRFRGIAEPDVIKTRILALKLRAETQRVAP
jgi:membrane protein YdbS with pleckstrin-like domain